MVAPPLGSLYFTDGRDKPNFHYTDLVRDKSV